jgi:GMP synthase-like glutamine amidotransferase
MRIGILECGAPPEPLRSHFGGYGSMVQRLLGASRDTAIFDVQAGALSNGPEDCDAFVLTGSAAGVYDDLPWIAELIGFLRQVRGRAKLVGICFGHQAMAEAFGGAVVKSPKGWGIGLQRYDVQRRADWMDGDGPVHIAASHQDQVVVCPPGARVTAASAFTPYAGLDYGEAISFQFHPEFEADFATALIEARRDRYGALADPAIASYERPDDRARVRQWIDRFLDAPSSFS